MPAETIAVVAFNHISPFHLTVPCSVFGDDHRAGGVPKYRVLVCAAEAGPLKTTAGFTIDTAHGLEALRKAQTIIVPSWRDPDEAPPEALLQALRKAHQRGAHIVGLCLGSFVLAAAGLLDGRPAATHWLAADLLARRYPNIRVDSDALYIDDGNILTSAGFAAGIDCCLHLLRSKCGAEAASFVARRMVVPPHRQGGQAQCIEQPVRPSAKTDRFSDVIDWSLKNLNSPQDLDTLAERACMSRRTFTRRFRAAMGTTVGQWLLTQRLGLAQRMLETTDRGIDDIADLAGFGTSVSLRQYFSRALGTSPSAYRREFRGHA